MKRHFTLSKTPAPLLARMVRLTQLFLIGFLSSGALNLVLAYSPEELAGQTISGVVLADNQLRFEDRGLIRDIFTRYQILVQDKNSGRVIFKGDLQPRNGERQINISLNSSVLNDHDHLIRISVKRKGKNLSAPLYFEKEIHQLAQLNPATYADREKISAVSVGNQILFTDATPHDGRVETRYRVKLQKRLLNILWESTVAEAEFNRKDVAHLQSSSVKLPLSVFGVTPDEVSSIQIEVIRISPRLNGASPIRFEKKLSI